MMQKITIAEIAKEANVSKATVSRVLSNPSIVQEKTRLRILEIINRHNYIPNQLAQGLAGTPTKTIGVVIDELSNDFFIEIAEGVDQILSPRDFSMQLSSSRWVQEKETKIIKTLISSRVDGILIAPISDNSESIELLEQSGIPFILINCIARNNESPYVSCNNIEGGKLAAEYISRHSKEQTILITGFLHQSLDDRIKGFSDHYKADAPLKHYPDVKTFDEGYNLVPILIAREKIREKKTTLFVTNDNVAIGIIKGLRENNIDIPQQVSIIGYDDIRLSSISQIPLTTISQSIRDIGKIAAMELLDLIDQPDREKPHFLIEPKLIIRHSSDPDD